MLNRIKNNKSNAFTLAEVLITLGIIGVVAALTIPTLINNSKKQEIVSKTLKAQSMLSGAINNYMLEEGCVGDLTLCDAYADDSDHQKAWDALKKYLKLSKDCGTAASGCWKSGISYKQLNNTNWSNIEAGGRAKGILSDGMLIGLYDYNGNCTSTYSRADKKPLLNVCGEIIIDVNGHNPPNQAGRDVFQFWSTSSGIVPTGAADDNVYADASGNPKCDPTSDDSNAYAGLGCTAKLLNERAMNY